MKRGQKDEAEKLKKALEAVGFRIDESGGSLYLWTTRGESCWETVGALADLGILVAPGEFTVILGGAALVIMAMLLLVILR